MCACPLQQQEGSFFPFTCLSCTNHPRNFLSRRSISGIKKPVFGSISLKHLVKVIQHRQDVFQEQKSQLGVWLPQAGNDSFKTTWLCFIFIVIRMARKVALQGGIRVKGSHHHFLQRQPPCGRVLQDHQLFNICKKLELFVVTLPLGTEAQTQCIK